jgi:hypothetical protein
VFATSSVSSFSNRQLLALLATVAVAVPLTLRGADLERPPIQYSKATPDNAVSRFQAALDSGKVRPEYDDDHGYLKSVLRGLNVPESSQVLVFSKTSMQRQRIGPKTPRAIYFNDEVYIGFCWRGNVLEVSAADPQVGTAFYTLDQQQAARPRFSRQTDTCLSCHAGSLTRGFPGHLARSVYTDRHGQPVLALGSVRVDATTPFADRWGGWYVTGTSGKQTHRGNQCVAERAQEPPAANPDGVNVTDLRHRFTVANYLTPHSDLVALLVLEHQTEMHNRLTRANFETREALYQQEEFDRILQRKSDGLSEGTAARIKSCCEPLVQCLLCCGEAKLTERVAGTSTFAAEFAARGTKDERGRSLRELDLERRLFRYPCSYLIHSAAFNRLPQAAKDYVYERLWQVLTGFDNSEPFAHLSAYDRRAILEILRDTKKDLPATWKSL